MYVKKFDPRIFERYYILVTKHPRYLSLRSFSSFYILFSYEDLNYYANFGSRSTIDPSLSPFFPDILRRCRTLIWCQTIRVFVIRADLLAQRSFNEITIMNHVC